MSKRAKVIIYGGCLFMLAVIGVIIFQGWKARKELMARGIRAEATVLELITEPRTKRNSAKYRVRVGLFLAEDKPVVAAKVETTPEPGRRPIDEKLDAIFSKMSLSQGLGDYETMTLSISGESFHKLKVGDRVKVIYLKEDPSTAQLLGLAE